MQRRDDDILIAARLPGHAPQPLAVLQGPEPHLGQGVDGAVHGHRTVAGLHFCSCDCRHDRQTFPGEACRENYPGGYSLDFVLVIYFISIRHFDM